MSTTISWVSDVVRKFQLRHNITDDHRLELYRLMVHRSNLLERMQAVCDAIHSQAGVSFMWAEEFTQPHPLARRYIYSKDEIEYSMALVFLPKGSTLVFASFKEGRWHGRMRGLWGWRSPDGSDSVKCKLLINPATVSDDDMQLWFTYLLSGLRRSFKPSHKMLQ